MSAYLLSTSQSVGKSSPFSAKPDLLSAHPIDSQGERVKHRTVPPGRTLTHTSPHAPSLARSCRPPSLTLQVSAASPPHLAGTVINQFPTRLQSHRHTPGNRTRPR